MLIEYQNNFTTEEGVLHDAVPRSWRRLACSSTPERWQAGGTMGWSDGDAYPIAFAEGYGEISDYPRTES